jgi:hypothetical protein
VLAPWRAGETSGCHRPPDRRTGFYGSAGRPCRRGRLRGRWRGWAGRTSLAGELGQEVERVGSPDDPGIEVVLPRRGRVAVREVLGGVAASGRDVGSCRLADRMEAVDGDARRIAEQLQRDPKRCR